MVQAGGCQAATSACLRGIAKQPSLHLKLAKTSTRWHQPAQHIATGSHTLSRLLCPMVALMIDGILQGKQHRSKSTQHCRVLQVSTP